MTNEAKHSAQAVNIKTQTVNIAMRQKPSVPRYQHTDAAARKLAFGREPESLIHLTRKLLTEILLKSSQFSVSRESFNIHVGGEEYRIPGSLVNSATFHSWQRKRKNF